MLGHYSKCATNSAPEGEQRDGPASNGIECQNGVIEDSRKQKRTRTGVQFQRYFTARLEAGKTPYDDVQWETRTATIGNDKGSVIFEQRDIEVPADWSQTATNIVASKYFHGKLGSPERETSVARTGASRGRHHRRLGQARRLFPHRGGRREFPQRTGAPDAAPEGLLQFAGLVQRGREGSARLRLGL